MFWISVVDGASFEAAQSDAAAQNMATGQGKVPHSTQPMVSLSAKAGWTLTAGADLHLSADDHITLASGQHTDWATGGAYRLHTGQAIGVLAGVIQPGNAAAGKGLTLIAAQGKVELQAQSDRLEIAAKEEISIQSESAHIDWAAAKKITLATAGGARVVIAGGNITVECPGTMTVRAGVKSFSGPSTTAYEMNKMPGTGSFDEQIKVVWPVGGKPVVNQRFELVRGDGSVVRGVTDAAGNTGLQKSDFPERTQIRILPTA